MPTEMLTEGEQRVVPTSQSLPSTTEPSEEVLLHTDVQRQAKRVRRMKLNLAVWGLATILITALWVIYEWDANGAFQRFAHEGNPGDWNPTGAALVIGIWGLVVGIMALRVHFERPATVEELDREVERLSGGAATPAADLRRLARERLSRVGRLRFHVSAWVLGMIVLAPLNALIEWQDNGGFVRFSSNSQPGSWDPWVLYIAGFWALGIAILALWMYVVRPRTRVRAEGDTHRLAPG